ncbi:MAG TPA: peptidoglycan editing factor PgeF [Bryobacteraceae bacterium]|nr:peptidoglycan editing factor PgeF [Bryobacteraceae bacterium]
MLFRNAEHVYQSDRLVRLPWLIHGFGTRLSTDWPREYTRVKQVHSDTIFAVDERPARVMVGDALVTRTPGRMVGVRTADCVPILLADPANRAVAAIHAGWRGTVQNIAGKTVERMRLEYGTNAADLLAVIGPSIGECCYEVGPEVAGQFDELMANRVDSRRLNLEEANRRQLIAAGLRNESIELGSVCTRCHEEFHSWRRDREAAGRMVAAIGILPQ